MLVFVAGCGNGCLTFPGPGPLPPPPPPAPPPPPPHRVRTSTPRCPHLILQLPHPPGTNPRTSSIHMTFIQGCRSRPFFTFPAPGKIWLRQPCFHTGFFSSEKLFIMDIVCKFIEGGFKKQNNNIIWYRYGSGSSYIIEMDPEAWFGSRRNRIRSTAEKWW